MSTLLVVSNVLLWIAVCVMALVIFALVRQIGVLYERVAPAGALAVNRRLVTGAEAPRLTVATLAGRSLEIGGHRADGRSLLLFFVGPDCPVCKALLPAVLAAARAERDWLDVVFASDGDEAMHREFVRRQSLEGFDYVLSAPLGQGYGVGKLPYAVLLDAAGRVAAFGIVNTREHLDSLFEAKERGVGSVQEYVAGVSK
jgi:methylamine dehydrogenase accessory protein MauD